MALQPEAEAATAKMQQGFNRSAVARGFFGCIFVFFFSKMSSLAHTVGRVEH